MATNTERELLEILVRKVEQSAAFNGGFEKLYLMIEHIQDEQDKSTEKLDKVSEALYDPLDGLFSRVRVIETKLDTNIKDLIKKCDVIPTVEDEIKDLKKFKSAIENITGPQLEELNYIVKLRTNLSKIYWALALSAAGAFASMIFNLWKQTH